MEINTLADMDLDELSSPIPGSNPPRYHVVVEVFTNDWCLYLTTDAEETTSNGQILMDVLQAFKQETGWNPLLDVDDSRVSVSWAGPPERHEATAS